MPIKENDIVKSLVSVRFVNGTVVLIGAVGTVTSLHHNFVGDIVGANVNFIVDGVTYECGLQLHEFELKRTYLQDLTVKVGECEIFLIACEEAYDKHEERFFRDGMWWPTAACDERDRLSQRIEAARHALQVAIEARNKVANAEPAH